MERLSMKQVTLASTDTNAVWDAMRKEGYSDRELGNSPELLAFVAKRSGIRDFKKIRRNQRLVIPSHASMPAVIREVRQNAGAYVDEMAKVDHGLDSWRRHYAAGAIAISDTMLDIPNADKPTRLIPSVQQRQAVSGRHAAESGQRLLPPAELRIKAGSARDFVRKLMHPLGLGTPSNTFTMEFSWTPPTEREDDTLITADGGGIGGYNLYYGGASGDYQNDIDVGNVASFAMEGLPSGVYYMVITTYDTEDRESLYSDELSWVVP